MANYVHKQRKQTNKLRTEEKTKVVSSTSCSTPSSTDRLSKVTWFRRSCWTVELTFLSGRGAGGSAEGGRGETRSTDRL